MKYEGINPLEKLASGEPYFFIRGQDVHAPAAIRAYATLLSADGDKLGALQVEALGEAVNAWQTAHPERVKRPD